MNKSKDQIIYELAKLAIDAYNGDKYADSSILQYLTLGYKFIDYDKQGYDLGNCLFRVDEEALEALKEGGGDYNELFS